MSKEKIHGIVLGTVRHNDRHNVTTVFTRERGRMAFLSPAGATKRTRATASRLQLMSVFEAEVNVSAARDLQFPGAFSLMRVWRTLWYDPVKSSVVMFICEFLQRLLRDAPPEPVVWDYIVRAAETLDSMTDNTSTANAHLAFLIGLMPLMGIQPDLTEFADGMEFDMEAGSMVLPWSAAGRIGKRVKAEEARMIPLLSRLNFRTSRLFRLSGKERSRILEGLLRYYGVHFPGTDNLRSPDILREIFS